MDYQKLYDTFIEDRRQHPTGEIRAQIHHIIPLSAGGSPGEENCIRLSIRDMQYSANLQAANSMLFAYWSTLYCYRSGPPYLPHS